MATKASTPWGEATLVEELTVPQRAGEKRFATVVQRLWSLPKLSDRSLPIL